MNFKKKQNLLFSCSGFTLVELLVVVAIIAILSSIAITGLNNLIPRYQVKSAAQDLQTNLQKAKMEAVKSNREALVTFTEAGDGDQGGYDVLIDIDGDGTNETIIDTVFTSENYKNAKLSSASFTNGVPSFQFNARGSPETPDGGNWSAGSINITGIKDPNYSLVVDVSRTGRIRIE